MQFQSSDHVDIVSLSIEPMQEIKKVKYSQVHGYRRGITEASRSDVNVNQFKSQTTRSDLKNCTKMTTNHSQTNGRPDSINSLVQKEISKQS